MVEVDRTVIEDVGISLLQMMENAGRNLADLAIRRFKPGRTVVVAGSGGNGGGGMAAARHLFNRGVAIEVLLIKEDISPVASQQRDVLRRMGVSVHLDRAVLDTADLVIDAVIGYSLSGAPHGVAADVMQQMCELNVPILALDTPSGVDVTTGEAFDPHIEATATMTLAAPKSGLVGHPAVGEHFLADISVPRSVYNSLGKRMGNPFAQSTIVRITG
ncbi:MAG: NAD(P)H-hydrate epimerase [Acidimicrobiia bacterium]|nr:NAD(P)H-hydrate epimerase [Acidimicrobiia bacterium]